MLQMEEHFRQSVRRVPVQILEGESMSSEAAEQHTVPLNSRSVAYRILIDIRTCGYTLGEMMQRIDELIAENPDMEIFMDGDSYAIVGKQRSVS